jgi:hypothetical protein
MAAARAFAGPDTGVGVSDERREHHRGDEEYAHAQQDHIDDVAQLVDDDVERFAIRIPLREIGREDRTYGISGDRRTGFARPPRISAAENRYSGHALWHTTCFGAVSRRCCHVA